MNGSFAGGLAAGLNNGMRMYDMYQEGQERKRKRQVDKELAEAMKAQQGGDTANTGAPTVGELESLAISDQARRDLQSPQTQQPAGSYPAPSPAQTFPVDTGGGQAPVMSSQPMTGQPVDASATGSGLRSQADMIPGLMMDIQQTQSRGAATKKASPSGARNGSSGGEDIGTLADSLTRGYRKALELGEPGRAMELLVQREKAIGQYRDQAFGEAMTRFNATGDPNAFVSFANRFAPTSLEISGITRRPETTADGAPVFVAHGIDHESGQPFQQVMTQQSLNNMLSAIGDPSVYKTLFADQAKHHYDLEMLRQKTAIETDAKGSLLDRQHQLRLGEISAQGSENRRTQAARGSVENKTAQPAEVRTAQWLIENGVADDASGAWDMVRGARSKPREQYILETSRMLLQNQNPYGEPMTPQQAVQQAEDLYNSLQGGGQSSASGAAQMPQAGAVEDGYRFKGGNPSDPNNWEKV